MSELLTLSKFETSPTTVPKRSTNRTSLGFAAQKSVVPVSKDVATLQDFARKIEQEFIQGSEIAPELFEAAVRFIDDTGHWEPNYALNLKVVTQWQTTQPHAFGSLAALQNEDNSLWQAKAENPRFDSKQQKLRKYDTPAGNGSRAYLPPIPPSIRARISERHGVNFPSDSSFWDFVAAHPEIPLVITEGGKKSLCLLSFGYVAISLYGVNGGYLTNERIGGEKIRKLKPELISDLQRFVRLGRRVILAFDQDETAEKRSKVAAALTKFGGLLAAAGCDVEIASWNGQDGKGIDDLIVKCSVSAWEKSCSEAVSFAQWFLSYQLAREVRRKPNLAIKSREFIDIASELPTEGIVALYGGKGSGKSKAIGELLKNQKWLSITHLSSLGRDQAAGWGGVFVNDGDRHGSKLLKDGVPILGGSVCVPSLLKVSAVAADVLILDEVSATLEFILGSKLANKDGIRPLLLAELIKRIQSARLVLIADADLTEEALQFIRIHSR